MATSGEGVGLGPGEFGEFVLDLIDPTGQVGGVDPGDSLLDSGGLLVGEDPAGQDPLPRGRGLVVDAFTSPVSGGGVASRCGFSTPTTDPNSSTMTSPTGSRPATSPRPDRRFLGRGEEVQPQRHQRPQLVQQGEFFTGVVAPCR